MKNFTFNRKVMVLIVKKKLIIIFFVFLIIGLLSFQNYYTVPFADTYGEHFAINYLDPGLHFTMDEYFIPIYWFVFHFIVIYLASSTVWRQHIELGTQEIFFVKDRNEYFIVKMFSTMLLAFLISLLIILPFFLSIVFFTRDNPVWIYRFSRLFLSLIVENMILTAFVFIFSLYVGYRISSILVFLYLFFVTLIPSPFLLGQGSLLMRQDFIDPEGFTKIQVVLPLIVFYIFCLFLLLYKSSRYDFLGERDEV